MSSNRKAFSSLLLGMAILFGSSCAQSEGPNTIKSESVGSSNEDMAVLLVHKAIRDNDLSDLRDHCLAYDFDDSSDKNYFIVDVREDKKYAICGGDPNTSVQLFRFKVGRKDHSLMTDAGSTDGSYHAVNE